MLLNATGFYYHALTELKETDKERENIIRKD